MIIEISAAVNQPITLQGGKDNRTKNELLAFAII
jgi:hypothetical protein